MKCKDVVSLIRENLEAAPFNPQELVRHLTEQSKHYQSQADILRAHTVGMLAGEAEPYRARARVLEDYAKHCQDEAEKLVAILEKKACRS